MPFLLSAAAILISVLMVTANAKSPIIIVPGLLSPNTFMINKPSGLERLPAEGDCLTKTALQDLTLTYNRVKRVFQSTTGADITVPMTGDTCSAEYRTHHHMCSARNPGQPTNSDDDYFHTFVEYFVKRGYVRGRTIRSAPYDWRMSPAQLTNYYIKLLSMIEDMSYAKDGVFNKVTLVAHSSGAPVVLYFLNNFVTQSFKERAIHAFVPISGAWSGGAALLQSLISGIQRPRTDLEPLFAKTCQPSKPLLTFTLYRDATRTFPGLAYLLPNPLLWGEKVIITSHQTSPVTKYTARDYKALYTDIGYPQGLATYELVASINGPFPAPNVPVYCFFGNGVLTPKSYTFGINGLSDWLFASTQQDENGDGTINYFISEKICSKWVREQPTIPAKFTECWKDTHISILKNATLLSAIHELVMKT